MVFTFIRPPSDVRLARIHRDCLARPLSYAEVGVSRAMTAAPAGYVLDHHRVRLGDGDDVFARAREAIRDWQPLRLGWVRPFHATAPPAEGVLTGTVIRACGVWWVNPCRVIYVIDEHERDGAGTSQRFGFAYGTVEGHVERGEERFLVERGGDGSVWYDLLAFSQPARWFTRLGLPLVRRLQMRFARDSMQAMRDRISHPQPGKGAELCNS